MKRWLEQMNVTYIKPGDAPVDCVWNDNMIFSDLCYKKDSAVLVFEANLSSFNDLMALLFRPKRSILFRLFLQREIENERKQIEDLDLDRIVATVLESMKQFLGQDTFKSIEQVLPPYMFILTTLCFVNNSIGATF